MQPRITTRLVTCVTAAVAGLIVAPLMFVVVGSQLVGSGARGTAAGPSEDLQPVATPVSDAAHAPPGLRLHVQVPTTLTAGRERRLPIAADSGPSGVRWGAPDVGPRRFELQLRVRPGSDLPAGAVWVRPQRILVSGTELRDTPVHIGVMAGASCGVTTGTLELEARPLADQGPTTAITIELPEVECVEPPPAPETVHITEPLCQDRWREQAEAILDGRDPPWGPCRGPRPQPRPRPVSSDADGADDDAEDNATSDGADDDAEDNATSDGAEDDPAADDAAADDTDGGAESPEAADSEEDRTDDGGDTSGPDAAGAADASSPAVVPAEPDDDAAP